MKKIASFDNISYIRYCGTGARWAKVVKTNNTTSPVGVKDLEAEIAAGHFVADGDEGTANMYLVQRFVPVTQQPAEEPATVTDIQLEALYEVVHEQLEVNPEYQGFMVEHFEDNYAELVSTTGKLALLEAYAEGDVKEVITAARNGDTTLVSPFLKSKADEWAEKTAHDLVGQPEEPKPAEQPKHRAIAVGSIVRLKGDHLGIKGTVEKVCAPVEGKEQFYVVKWASSEGHHNDTSYVKQSRLHHVRHADDVDPLH